MLIYQFGKVVQAQAISGVPTAQAVNATCAPIALKPMIGPSATLVNFNYGGPRIDVASIYFTAQFTAQSGTSPTGTLKIQGAMSPFENQTTLSGNMTNATTTMPLQARDGIAANTFVMLVAKDGSAMEWVLNTSGAATGTGNLTVTRGQFGTTGTTFTTGDYAFFVNSWVDIPTSSGTLASSATSLTGAAISTPVNVTVDSNALGLTNIDYALIRPVVVLGGTTPTATVTIHGGAKVRGTFRADA